MKNLIKLFLLVLLVVGFVSCNDEEGSDITVNEELGWVQFLETNLSNITTEQVFDNKVTIDINIQVPNTSKDLIINYDLVPISGLNPNTAFSNTGSTTAPAGLTSWASPTNGGLTGNNTATDYPYLASIDFNLNELPLLTENMVFDVVLTSTNQNSITAGINDEKPITQRVTICHKFLNTLSFTGDSYSDDLAIGSGVLVNPYQTNLIPVAGVCSTWTTSSIWGPEFVSNLTGGQVAVGSFLNPSTLVLNDDNTVSVTGDNGTGTGLYNPATGDIQLSIAQTIFNGSFTVDVTLSAN